MGSFLIFILVVFVIFPLLFGARTIYKVIRFIFGGGRNSAKKNRQSTEKPASQDERIINYKKKEFETSAAEDVDFEEIKDGERNK